MYTPEACYHVVNERGCCASSGDVEADIWPGLLSAVLHARVVWTTVGCEAGVVVKR